MKTLPASLKRRLYRRAQEASLDASAGVQWAGRNLADTTALTLAGRAKRQLAIAYWQTLAAERTLRTRNGLREQAERRLRAA